MLAISVDAAHSLFQAVRVPGDIIIKENITALEVNSFSRRFSGHKNLDCSVLELLLHKETGTGLIPESSFHAAVDTPNPETPTLQAVHEIIKRILEFRKDKQSLVGLIKEAFLLKQVL
jgi:hypothetical protein